MTKKVSSLISIVLIVGSLVASVALYFTFSENNKLTHAVVLVDYSDTSILSHDSVLKWRNPQNDSSTKWYSVYLPSDSISRFGRYYCRAATGGTWSYENDTLDSIKFHIRPRFYNKDNGVFLSNDSWASHSLFSTANLKKAIWVVILFVVMLIGMFANQIFEILQIQKTQGKTTTNIADAVSEGFRGITFWMAIVVSPIIFFATYSMVSSIVSDAIAIFYSFQNGFFWFTIFGKIEKGIKNSKENTVVETE